MLGRIRMMLAKLYGHGCAKCSGAFDEVLPLDSEVRGLLEELRPSPTDLFELLRSRVDDSMLQEIAEADYGEDAEEHFRALKRVQTSGELPPNEWIPMEVIELIRFSQPDDPTWKPGSTGTRGHVMRAYCCVILLRIAADPKNYVYFEGENQTIIQLIDSALALGGDAQLAALRLLCWRTLSLPRADDEYPFFALAILLLAVRLGALKEDGIIRLADWVVAEEERIRNAPTMFKSLRSDIWLFGLTNYNSYCELWQKRSREVLLGASGDLSPAAIQPIKRILYHLSGELSE
jgi:hypothetical protein